MEHGPLLLWDAQEKSPQESGEQGEAQGQL